MTNETTEHKPKSALAISALVLGIVALVFSAIPIINNFAFVFAIAAFAFGVAGIASASGKKRSGLGIAIASIVVATLAAVVVLASQAYYSYEVDKITGDATEEVLGTDVDVSFGTYTLKKGSYGSIESSLPVRVTNLTDERASFAVQIEATDADGNRITEDTVFFNELAPGQAQVVKAFQFVSRDDYETMRSARFSIVSISEY